MMLPAATLTHSIPGRVRLRIPSRKGDVEYFSGVQASLSEWKPARRVDVNPVTGSILVLHDGTLEDLEWLGLEEDLFALHVQDDPPPVMQSLADGVTGLDDRLQARTRGALHLKDAVVLSLVAAGLIQVLRGQVLGPAAGVFSLAVGVLALSRDRIGIGNGQIVPQSSEQPAGGETSRG